MGTVLAGAIGLLVVIAALMLLVRAVEPRFAFFPSTGEDVTPRELGARFEAITIPTADGERLHAWHLPANPAGAHIIYFHGNGGNLSVWAPILVELPRHGYSVLAADYRGYGRSTGRASAACIAMWTPSSTRRGANAIVACRSCTGDDRSARRWPRTPRA